jgi:endogenous inhibitor of DNA gyrase (YacG/DUF329 family)
MNKICPECGDKIIGRADKKFCSDACRNAHNNALNKDSKNIIRTTNNRLRKNYRILEKLNNKDKTKVTKTTLIKNGFLFEYCTGTYITKAGDLYYYIYDQGYLPLKNDIYLLIKRD